jgi:hypothetical protein
VFINQSGVLRRGAFRHLEDWATFSLSGLNSFSLNNFISCNRLQYVFQKSDEEIQPPNESHHTLRMSSDEFNFTNLTRTDKLFFTFFCAIWNIDTRQNTRVRNEKIIITLNENWTTYHNIRLCLCVLCKMRWKMLRVVTY